MQTVDEREKDSWVQKILGGNGHQDRMGSGGGGGLGPVDKAIATAVIWCVAALLLLRFRNPEMGFILGGLGVAATVFIWKKR